LLTAPAVRACRRDRRAPGGQRGHGEEPRQPHAGEDRRAWPCPGRGLRVPARTRVPV